MHNIVDGAFFFSTFGSCRFRLRVAEILFITILGEMERCINSSDQCHFNSVVTLIVTAARKHTQNEGNENHL